MSTFHTIKKTYQYKITDGGNTSGKIMYPPSFAFSDGNSVIRTQEDMGSGSEVYYSRVKELTPSFGSTVYIFDVPNMYPNTSPTTPSSKIARPSGGSCSAGSMKNGVYTFPFAPSQDLDYKRGMLRRVSQYTESGVLTSERRLNYTEPQSATYIKGLKFESALGPVAVTKYHYTSYLVPVSQSKIVVQEVVKTIGDDSAADSVRVTTGYTYNSLNELTQSLQTNDDGSTVASNVKYSHDYTITSPTLTDVQAVAINKLNTTKRGAQVIETWQTFTPIGGSGVVTNASLNLFKDYGTYVWPNKSKFLPQGFAFTPSSVATGGTQGFTSDADYVTTSTTEFADALPVNQTDLSLSTSSIHYSTGLGAPVATFFNCKAENAVYEGFEFATGHGLTGGTTSTPAWTGQKAMALDNSFTLNSAPVTKSENSYRVSFWAYASASNTIVTINTMNGASVSTTDTIKVTTANKWIYRERFINTTSTVTTFTFKISSPTPIRIDEFTAIPKSARISSKTFLPFTGGTSETDDRGNSTIVVYDVLGRPGSTLDRNRNLVGVKDYGLQKNRTLDLEAAFTTEALNFLVGESADFHALVSTCIPGITYLWTFTTPTGVPSTASGVDVSHIFGIPGENSIKLTVSKSGYTSKSYTQLICVIATSVVPVTFLVSPSTTVHKCDPVNSRTRTFQARSGYISAGKLVWYVSDEFGDFHELIQGDLPPGAIIDGDELTYESPERDYTVMCVITVKAGSINCPHQGAYALGTVIIHWVDDSPCP